MENRLKQVLKNKGENYILPFYWQHGEDEKTLRLGLEKIHQAGIGAICVESRPHPDFLGPRWWSDLDIIMDEARKRKMRVWVFDDSHFPTGYANGAVKLYPKAGKSYLTHYCIDVIGPLKKAAFMVDIKTDEHHDEQLIAVIGGKRNRNNPFTISDPLDLTDLVTDDLLYWDVPEGFWCITVIKTTRKGIGRPHYINVIDEDAVKLLIDTVYEPHYRRYKADFGSTFAGFFSDEPELGNAAGGKYGHRAVIGTHDLPLPWSRELEQQLMSLWQDDYGIKLVGLWHDIEGSSLEKSQKSPAARYDYMDLVTKLYQKCFSSQIGNWCRARSVEYIGHVIEDGNCHSATGLGTGHFFRALWGQDMSGIDVVLQQIRPGLDDTAFYRIGGNSFYCGQFFHYGLGKLGASLGHLDPKKQGRTVCEIFGAYGWSEGLKMMKWLVDHMLVRGINHWIPHAFTTKDFPDFDCPPHFYAQGMNPQYPYFKYLINYMNRVSHLINGGVHIPNAAILYDAELDWVGDYRPLEYSGRVLSQNQIDYEIIPADILLNCRVENKQLTAAAEKYQALIIPKSEYLSEELINWCSSAIEEGFLILSMDKNPESLESDNKLNAQVVTEDSLVDVLKDHGVYELELTKACTHLRYYHYRQPEFDLFLLFNESPNLAVNTEIKFRDYAGPIYQYDAFDNKLYNADYRTGYFKLELQPYQAAIIVLGEIEQNFVNGSSAGKSIIQTRQELTQPWHLKLIPAGGELLREGWIENLIDITGPNNYPYFSGIMEYDTKFVLTGQCNDSGEVILDLGEVYETVQVWVNGQSAGVRITPPYELMITDFVKPGENQLKIRVINHLGHQQRDVFSQSLPLEPSGLLGPVVLKYYHYK